MKRVYLAGPVAGLMYSEAVDWREYVKVKLAEGDSGIIGVSPMRTKEFLKDRQETLDSKEMLGEYLEELIVGQRGLFARDSFDVDTCDVLLGNFLGVKNISVGSVWEYGRVSHRIPKVPVITVIEREGNPHDHSMIRETTDYRLKLWNKVLQS